MNDPVSPTTVTLVLAAGGGSRFTGATHKLLAVLDGRPIVAHAIAAASAAAIGPVVVVTGAVDIPVDDDLDPAPAVVVNPRWAEGQMTSLRAGLDAARSLGAAAVVVGLGDQPFVTPAAWRAVAASTAPIAVASYDGRRANPVRLAAAMWDLLPGSGDEGARALMRLRPDLVEGVPCEGSPSDIDTLEDLRRWQSDS